MESKINPDFLDFNTDPDNSQLAKIQGTLQAEALLGKSNSASNFVQIIAPGKPTALSDTIGRKKTRALAFSGKTIFQETAESTTRNPVETTTIKNKKIQTSREVWPVETTSSKNINFQTSREVWPVETTTFKNLFFQASGEALPVEKTTSKNIMAGNSSSTPRLSISPSAKNKMILISQTKSRKLNKLREWPQDFINIVTSLNEMRYPTPHHSQFKFEMSALAAEHNRKISYSE